MFLDKKSSSDYKPEKNESKKSDSFSTSFIVNNYLEENNIKKDYCKYCGEEIKTDNIYCGMCGKQLKDIPESKESREERTGGQILIVIVLLIIILTISPLIALVSCARQQPAPTSILEECKHIDG